MRSQGISLLVFLCTTSVAAFGQSSVEALGGASDAAQGVFDRISGDTNMDSVTDTVYDAVDVQVQPQYPGGMKALFTFLTNSIPLPGKDLEDEIQGKVIVEFVVRKDGTVQDIKLRQGVRRDLCAEVVRAVEKMPAWTPGSVDGKPVSTRYVIPIMICIQSSGSPTED